MSRTVTDADRIAGVRAAHRGTRNAGFVACLLGAMALIAGRYWTGAPPFLLNAGLGLIVFGWGLFAYALFRRLALARAASRR